MSFTSYLEKAREMVASLPLDLLREAGFFIDLSKDNPDNYRYFVLCGEWRKVTEDEIFSSFIPQKGHQTHLYVNIPFCKKICTFCKFSSSVPTEASLMDNYINALKKEITILKHIYFEKGTVAAGLAFGGGTPSYVPLEKLKDLIEHIYAEIPFTSDFEFSFEASPEDFVGNKGIKKLEYLKESGVNRLSLGLQSFNDDLLQLANRSNSVADNLEVIGNIKSLGFRRINADLMLGIFRQGFDDFFDSLQRTIEFDFDVININPLTLLSAWHYISLKTTIDNERNSFLLDQDILVARTAADMILKKAGYSVENSYDYRKTSSPFSYFAEYNRHFYRGGNIVSIGQKAGTYIDSWQYASYNKIDKYIQALDEGRLPIGAGCRMSEAAEAAKSLIGRLLLSNEINYSTLRQCFSLDIMKTFDSLMRDMVDLDLLTADKGLYHKTYSGFLFSNEILKKIYLLGTSPCTPIPASSRAKDVKK
jgi:coproporphyrinogen III oxidase-like Fe-S oxidoreductase